MIGKQLSHYTILEELGAGGMGVVYRAVDGQLKREVALKVLPKEVEGRQNRLQRFQREAQALAALNHPNIVTIYSVDDADGVPFLTMELVDGKCLHELMQPRGLPLSKIFQIAIPIADALSKAHEKGVIHRDLKPANIMIDCDGRTKVLDFGIAKLIRGDSSPGTSTTASTETLTGEAQLVGTLPYIAPEQIDGHSADTRSDLFSFGVVLYEMATGGRPFVADTTGALIAKIMRDVPPDVDTIRRDLPHHFGRIARRCLEKDPERRYQHAKDVRNDMIDLRRELESVSSDDSRPPPPHAGWRFVNGWRVAALALVAIVAVGLGGVALNWSLSPSDGESVPPPGVVEPSDRKMIVALPFENLGPPEDEYFAVGMTDEIAFRLASVAGLGVISRTNAMRYRENRPSLAEIAAELDVEYILEGSIRWQREPSSRGRMRIILHLVRAADDLQVWSGRYERVLDDIFAVQGEIAEQVIRELEVAIGEPVRQAMSEPLTDNLEAYNWYLRAMEYRRAEDYSESGLELATQLLDRAVELDPDFARAWAELTWVHSLLYFNDDPSDERRERATAAMDRADQLAPDSAAVRAAAGFYYYRVHKDFHRALEEFEIALRGQPGNLDVLIGIGLVRRRLGLWNGSIEILEHALELDPRSGEIANSIGEIHAALREYEQATGFFDRAVTLAPDQPRFWSSFAFNELNKTREVAAARRLLSRAPNPGDPFLAPSQMTLDLYELLYEGALGRLSAGDVESLGDHDRSSVFLMAALAHEHLGQDQEARHQAEKSRTLLEAALEERPDNQYIRSRLALTYAFLGRDQAAIDLGRAAAEATAGDAFSGPRFVEELAKIYARTGRFDRSIELVDQLLSTPYFHALGPTQLELDPIWAPLRGEPEYQSLVQSLN